MIPPGAASGPTATANCVTCCSPESWPTGWREPPSPATACTQVSQHAATGVGRRRRSQAGRLRSLLVAGVVYTHLGRSLSNWLQLLLLPFAKLFFVDAEGGSQTVLHCALREGIEPLSGRYFSSCALQQVGARGRDDAVAKKLWEVSERLTGLS